MVPIVWRAVGWVPLLNSLGWIRKIIHWKKGESSRCRRRTGEVNPSSVKGEKKKGKQPDSISRGKCSLVYALRKRIYPQGGVGSTPPGQFVIQRKTLE